MKTQFSDRRSWNGGYYELSIEIGPRSDELLQQSLDTIWQTSYLRGCYLDRYIEPEKQNTVKPDLAYIHNSGHFHGIATLSDGQEIVCGTVFYREKEGPDRIDLYIPLATLGGIYPEVGGYPFGDLGSRSRSWRQPLESWMAEIGRILFSKVQFRLGLIGYEVSGTMPHSKMSKNDIPKKRSVGYLLPTPDEVQYYPTNKW